MLRSGARDPGWVYAVICLVVIALQMGIIGIRFGYGMVGMAAVQSVGGVLVPRLIWLAFAPPTGVGAGAVHLWPVAALAVILAIAPIWQDVFVASVALVYAAALALLIRQGEDGVPWASAAQVPLVRRLVWCAVVILIATGITDAVAAIAVMRGQESWIGGIVAGAMVIVAASLGVVRVSMGKAARMPPDAGNPATFVAVETLMREDRIYRDADLTLGRIARKLHLPVKAVSRAVNAGAGVNVSQYINGFRVSDACDGCASAIRR